MDEHDETERAEKSAVDEVFAELRQASQGHAKDLADLDHAELRLAFETLATRLRRHGMAVPLIHGPGMIIRVVDLYLLDITNQLTHQVKLRVRAEQRACEADSRVADLRLELFGANHRHEKAEAGLVNTMVGLVEVCDNREHLERELTRLRGLLAADPQGDGQAERARVALDDIRCDILNTGWPLGDDADPELTPRRLVREVLAEVASLRALFATNAEAAARAQDELCARVAAAESALAVLGMGSMQVRQIPVDAPAVMPVAAAASESAPVSTAPKTDAPASWLLAPALERQLPPFLQNLSVVEVYASKDALCVSPSGWYWMATSNEVRGGLEVSVSSATRRGEIIPNGECFSTLFPAPWSPVFVRNPSVAEPVAAPTAWRLSCVHQPTPCASARADRGQDVVVTGDHPPAARRWRLTSALLERLPEALQHLKVLQRCPSPHPGIGADALCVAPDGAHWAVLHEDFIKGEFDAPNRQAISVRRANEHGKPIRDCEFHYATLPADQLPVVVPDEDPVLPG